MARFAKLRRKKGPNICRRCVNQSCHFSLRPANCVYYIYPAECSRFKEKQHIIIKLRWTGKCKLLFRRMPQSGV